MESRVRVLQSVGLASSSTKLSAPLPWPARVVHACAEAVPPFILNAVFDEKMCTKIVNFSLMKVSVSDVFIP